VPTDQSVDHAALGRAWQALRRGNPLVLCITNRVTPQRVADTLLAAGAAPVMADNPREVAQMASIADAIYLNTGLHETQIASLAAAAGAIATLHKPAVLDPVGAGATAYRSAQIARVLAGARFSAVRGNASEIRALAGVGAGTRGVDARDSADAAADAAHHLARTHGCVVAVSGERDLISDGVRIVRVGGGHPWLTRMTGSGCALGALTAACIAAAGDPWLGTLTAHAAFALAADRGATRAAGPGTLSVHVLDALAALEPEDFAETQVSVQPVPADAPGGPA